MTPQRCTTPGRAAPNGGGHPSPRVVLALPSTARPTAAETATSPNLPASGGVRVQLELALSSPWPNAHNRTGRGARRLTFAFILHRFSRLALVACPARPA